MQTELLWGFLQLPFRIQLSQVRSMTSRLLLVSRILLLLSSILFVGLCLSFKKEISDFPGGAVVESLPANAGDTGSSPGLGRSHMPRSD